MEFEKLAEDRYSCRKMSDRKVEPALIEKIIATAGKAPTAVNRQPFKIFWMNSEEAKQDVRQAGSTFGADTFLIVGYRQEDGWVRDYDRRPFADVDAAIVATHMMLQIADLGLATTWVGHFNAPMLREKYPSMKDYDLIALFPIGYPVKEAMPSPRHFERKTREEVTVTL